jgi:hypothetical protein
MSAWITEFLRIVALGTFMMAGYARFSQKDNWATLFFLLMTIYFQLIILERTR